MASLLSVSVGALIAANRLRTIAEQKAISAAELTADTVIALTVSRNFNSAAGLAPGARVTAPQATDIQADVDLLQERNVLLGLAVWRLDGSLAFADAQHSPGETRMPEEERIRAESGGFVQPGATRSGGGKVTWEVVRPYDANRDGTADGIVEVVLPATGQAQIERVTRRLSVALGVLVVLLATGLIRFHRRLVRRRYRATHDQLTGVGNRLALEERDQVLRRGPEPTAALILLDLDEFKAVNDTLGHNAGDQLLVQVARTLESLVRPSDLVVRLGGDEFAVMLSGPQTRASALAAAREIIKGLAEYGFSVDEVLLDVHASAGIALRPEDATSAAGLLQRADVAMYQAKESGAGAVLYDVDLDPHDVPKLRAARPAATRDRGRPARAWTISPKWTWPPVGCAASRRWSVGSTPNAVSCRRTLSSRWRSAPP